MNDKIEELMTELKLQSARCTCGCGGLIEIKQQHISVGIPRFILGHNSRGRPGWSRGKTRKNCKIIDDMHKGRDGKNYDEMYGIEKSKQMRQNRSTAMKGKNKGKVGWNQGLRKETNAGVKKISISVSTAIKEKWQDKDYIQKQYESKFNPNYIKKIEERGNKNYFTHGWFKSYKNNYEIYFRSSYELYAYIKLEHDDNVKQYGRCSFGIPYFYKGGMHAYWPDIGVEFVDGLKSIIEVKPLGMMVDKLNLVKFNAGKNYCRDNGMVYTIWTEKDFRGKMQKVFVDVDGVVRNIDNSSKVWLLKIEGQHFVDYVTKNRSKILKDTPECEYCKPLQKWIENFGCVDLRFLSCQPKSWIPYTERWLKKRFPTMPVRYVKSTEEKLSIIKGENAILIDDYPLFTSYDRVAIVDRPYNKHIKSAIRVKGELDFIFLLAKCRFLDGGKDV